MEPGFRVAAPRPLRMVLGSNYAGRSGREACWAGRWNVSGAWQFRRSLSSQLELSLVRPNTTHTYRTLPGFVQLVLADWFRWVSVHRGAHWAIGRWFEDWGLLLFASPCSRLSFVSRASDARCVEVCTGANPAVPVPFHHSPAHPCRPHPAPAFADVNQRLAWGTSLLVKALWSHVMTLSAYYILWRIVWWYYWWPVFGQKYDAATCVCISLEIRFLASGQNPLKSPLACK